MRGAIDLWASEKADYLKELNNELHGATGHYVALITPENRYYGFAGASGMRYGTTWSGEMASTLQGSQTATNLKGTYEFSVNVSVDKLAQGVSVELPSQLKMGQQAQAKAKLAYMGGRYELRGGWTSSNLAVLSVDAKVTVPVNTFSRTGHTFTGWNTKANGTGTAYKPDAQYTLGSSDAALYAQWKLNTYTVQFDGNGASTSVVPVQVQHGKTIAQPDTPMNIGRAFAGWYTARTGGARFDFTTPVTGNMTLYARWNRMDFADVQQGGANPTPHAADIQWLADNGISKGWQEPDGTSTFRGMNPVVRQDMAAFLKRLADAAGKSGGVKPKADFTDVTVGQPPHWAAIQWLGGSGISTGYRNVNGSWRFEGMTSVYRQDMAAFIHRLDSRLA